MNQATERANDQLFDVLIEALQGMDADQLEAHSLGDVAVTYEQLTGERGAVIAVTENRLEDAFAEVLGFLRLAGYPL